MTLKAKALVLTLLLGTLALPALADRRGPGPGGPGSPGDSALTDGRFLTHYLNLSTSQVTQLQGFLKTLQAAGVTVRTARGPLCQQLRTDLGASHPNPTTVGQDFLALVDNDGKIKTALQAFDTSFSAILNGDQLARYEALKQIVARGDGKALDPLPQCPPASS
ncbi:MAG TPA: hypothetical protein VGG20_14080 [Thermoanaerobaculia bacterium]